jgi:hypothetical protein
LEKTYKPFKDKKKGSARVRTHLLSSQYFVRETDGSGISKSIGIQFTEAAYL